jgi:hypothetical protein
MEKWYFCEKFYCNIDDIKEGTNCEFFVDKESVERDEI